MSAILVTGMSGAGKSSVLGELAARGYDTVDTDYGDWIAVIDGEPLWDETRMTALLAIPRTSPLFVQGTVANQGRFYDRFAAVVLLSAPLEVLLDRVRTRTTNDFGKSPEQLARIASDVENVEPLLRSGATHELDATRSLADLADELVEISRR